MTDYVDQYAAACGSFDTDSHVRNTELLKKVQNKNKNVLNLSQLEQDDLKTLDAEISPFIDQQHNLSFKKTGTTICGVQCVDGVVLAADTRATAGGTVVDPNCSKLHFLSNNIFGAGAGTAADLQHTTEWLHEALELQRLNSGMPPRVAMAVNTLSDELFKYQGHRGCACVIGGVDITGPSLYTVAPHGSTDQLPYCAMGSGSLNALTVLETYYKDGMTVSEAKKLVAKAISAGVTNDLGSGSNVDVLALRRIPPTPIKHKRTDLQNELHSTTQNTGILGATAKVNMLDILDSEDDAQDINTPRKYSDRLTDSTSYPLVNNMQKINRSDDKKQRHTPYQRHFSTLADGSTLVATHYRRYIRPIIGSHPKSTSACRFPNKTTPVIKESIINILND